MGHQVEYIVQTAGAKFNAALDISWKATESDLATFNHEGALWDGRLPGSSLDFAADLSSEAATLIMLPLKYSLLVPPGSDPDTVALVGEWEGRLSKVMPFVPIMRFDEALFEEWGGEGGSENWLKDNVEVNRFLVWLEAQDEKHWKRIQ